MLGLAAAILLPKPGQNVAHLWVVITEPDPATGEVIIVNLTTQRPHSDTTVILQAGDHPFIKHPTAVNFIDARIVILSLLEQAIATGTGAVHQIVEASVLKRIQDGLLRSSFTPNKIKAFFRARME